MIAELIKLSKELYELEMVDESMDIDNMIHKLYGLPISGVDTPMPCEEDGSDFDRTDNLRYEFERNASNVMFKNELASIIQETLSPNDVEDLIGLLKEYIE